MVVEHDTTSRMHTCDANVSPDCSTIAALRPKKTGLKSEKAIEVVFAKNNAKPLIRTTSDPKWNQKLKTTPTKRTIPNWPHCHAAVVEKSNDVVQKMAPQNSGKNT